MLLWEYPQSLVVATAAMAAEVNRDPQIGGSFDVSKFSSRVAVFPGTDEADKVRYVQYNIDVNPGMLTRDLNEGDLWTIYRFFREPVTLNFGGGVVLEADMRGFIDPSQFGGSNPLRVFAWFALGFRR